MIYFQNIEKFTKENFHWFKLLPKMDNEYYAEIFSKGILSKDKLEIGKYYFGKCRNANVARWDGDYFTYMRTKFGNSFPEKINHLSDDNGYDLFIPLEEIEPTEITIIR